MTTSPVRSTRHGTGTGNGSNNGTHQHQQMGSTSYGYRERQGGGGEPGHRSQESERSTRLGEEQHDVDLDEQEDVDMDEGDASLIAQTLNADGTPKRPMNAFMIFARRRRPQVSAENQMMRTGEISKILSREWSSMPMSEKQFYLDQAKKLKDAFNVKYPDYVYRRRPNNSRRRRRSDSGAGSAGSIPGAIRATGSGGPLSASDQSEQELDPHERDDHASFDSGSPVEYRHPMGGGPGSGGPGLGHMGYSDIVVHPATSAGPTSGTHPGLLGGLPSLNPLSGHVGGGPGGGLAPPSAYPRAPFTPLSASSSGTGTSAGGGSDHQPVSPLSPYARYSPYSPVTPATSTGSGYPPGASSSYGQSSSAHSYSDNDFGHSTNGNGSNASGATHPTRLSSLDWPSEPPHHHQPHSAYPHSPADPSPHGNFWGSRSGSSSAAGGAGSVPSSWPLSSLPPTGLPPPSGSGAAARARLGSGGSGLGLNLSLGTSSASASALGQGQGHGTTLGQTQSQAQGRPKEYKDLFNPLPPPTGSGSASGSTAAAIRDRAWSTTPSNASASPSAGGRGGGPQFPTLTEPFHPNSQHNRGGSSSGSSPSVGFARSGGAAGELADIYDASQSQQQSAYPISPLSPYPHSQQSSQGQSQSQGQGSSRPTLLHPIATFGAGGGNVSPRDVSPLSAVSPHSAVPQAHPGGGSGYWGERLSER